MAQLHITLNQEEILQLLAQDRNEAFKSLWQNALNSILKSESEAQLQAAPYERTENRTDSRNGFRHRDLQTRIGTISLAVPRHRNTPFTTMVFATYNRSEAALVAAMAEMVVNGVSTRKVSKVVETLCGTSISKSAVSSLCKELDKEVEAFRNRPLTEYYPFVTVDATYFKVRENHRVISKALMIAYATNHFGAREVLGFGLYKNESKETWTDFLTHLKKRGLKEVPMITSDAHEGIIHAMTNVFPEVPWQRCQFHFIRNILDKTAKKYQLGLQSELQEMFHSATMEKARARRDAILADYSDVAEEAVRCLEEGFESAMTVMYLEEYLRRYYRTSNHMERLNKELKRRSKVIGIFPNGDSVIRLMGSVLVEHHNACQAKRKVFSLENYRKLMNSGTRLTLIHVAQQQHQLLVA